MDIEFRDLAVTKLHIGDLQRALLNEHVLLGQSDSGFQGTQNHVGPRHLCCQRDHNRVITGDFRLELSSRRFDHPPEPAPEIHLPGEAETQVVQAEIIFEQRDVIGAVLADLDLIGGTRQLLYLRIFAPGRNPQLCLCLQYANARSAQRQVLGLCRFNQLVQDRIIEYGPPFRMVGRLVAEHFLVDLGPFFGDRCFRGFEIGAQGGAARENKQNE